MAYTGREDTDADRAIKSGVKKVGNKILSPIRKKIMGIILTFIGYLLLALLPIIIILVLMRGIIDMALAVKEGFIKNVWAGLTNMAMYDEDRMNAWNSGGDPDQTALIYQQMVSANNAGEKEYLKEYGTNEVIDSLSEDSAWRDLMRNEHPLLAQNDMTYILQRAYDKNNEMFRMKHAHYSYEQWELYELPQPPGVPPKWDIKKNSDKGTETSNDDDIYDNLTREHIEGEEDDEGDKIFASHWQDAFALATYYSLENYDNWGTSDESKYDPYNDGIHGNEPLDINDTDGYYITDADLQMVCDLFEYNFTYYWDEIADLSHDMAGFGYKFSGYKAGDYTTGYRFRRLLDPELKTPPPWDSPDEYERVNQDLTNPYEYLSYSDTLAYDETTLPFTQFTPESCPNTISNSIESYKYIYTPIYPESVSGDAAMDASLVHLDEGGTTDYAPDPENFTPPNGDYCIGRWHVVDPREIIDTMALLGPWYKDRSEGEEGEKWVKVSGYNWVDDMIEHYNMYLAELPGTENHTISRMDYFQHLADLYNHKKIEVFYEGTKYEGMEDYYERLKNQLLHPTKDAYVAINIDGTLDKSKDAESTETIRDGVVKAIKWMESQNMKYVFVTSAIDLDSKKAWIQSEILTKLSTMNGYKGTYRVTRKDRYGYCKSHKIDVLIDDAPNVIEAAAKHMPVIEVKCSDWDSQPTGHNITVMNSWHNIEDAMEEALKDMDSEEDYSDWTVTKDYSKAKDTFYNYQQKPESEKYPFYSYGVTYHNKEEKHIPEDEWGEEEDPDDDPGGGVLPDVPIGDPSDKVYIYAHDGHKVDGWYYIYEGADTPLDAGIYYSKSQIHAMLAYMEGQGGIDFTSATDAVYEWNQSTGADFAAMCAIIMAEGGNNSRHGRDHWNFFDFVQGDEAHGYPGKDHTWWDAKKDCATIGEAMVRAMNKIVANYWKKGQNTFYKMCFNQYGYPQTAEEAKARDAYFSHCYCPWWQDTGYLTTGYDSYYSWCNKNARLRAQFAAMVD